MRFFLFLLVLITFFTSCEDKKKTPQVKTQIKEEKKKDSIVAKDTTVLQDKVKKYPKITNENVVDFLTAYGKNNPENEVVIETQHGNIEITLHKDAPLHRANFIYLIKQNYFENTFFHRIVPNFIIQGGNSDLKSTPKKRFELGKSYLLPSEVSNGRRHLYGTISGAKEYRENPDKRSAPFEFFIFLGPQTSTSHLNGNYTVFGKVTKGMDVVETIANLPSDEGDWPLSNVYISVTTK